MRLVTRPGWESGPVCTNLLCSTVTYVLTFAPPKPLGLCLTSVAWLALCIWVPLVVSLSGSPVSLFPRAGEGPFLLLPVSYMQQAHRDPLVEGVTHLGMNILSILAARLPAAHRQLESCPSFCSERKEPCPQGWPSAAVTGDLSTSFRTYIWELAHQLA